MKKIKVLKPNDANKFGIKILPFKAPSLMGKRVHKIAVIGKKVQK